jgi:NHS family xanthosine MFS transporter
MEQIVGFEHMINAIHKHYTNVESLYAGVYTGIHTLATPETFIYIMLLAMCFYMPTIASNSISYNALKLNNKDVIKNFPPIRV